MHRPSELGAEISHFSRPRAQTITRDRVTLARVSLADIGRVV
jgi:hypothetical protein